MEHIVMWSTKGVHIWAFIIHNLYGRFTIYIPNVEITMFADDTSFARDFKNVDEIKEHLVPAFSKIFRWLNINKRSLNTVETEFMIIGTPNSISKLDRDSSGTPYMIVGASDCRIRRVKLVKSLGLIVGDTLTWSDDIDYSSTKINRGIGIMKKTSKFLDKNSLLMPYRTLVETHFRYCNVVWGQCNDILIDRLKILQNKAARVIKKVKVHLTLHAGSSCEFHLFLVCQHVDRKSILYAALGSPFLSSIWQVNTKYTQK